MQMAPFFTQIIAISACQRPVLQPAIDIPASQLLIIVPLPALVTYRVRYGPSGVLPGKLPAGNRIQ